jgi:hypothetical protein
MAFRSLAMWIGATVALGAGEEGLNKPQARVSSIAELMRNNLVKLFISVTPSRIKTDRIRSLFSAYS